MMTGMCCQASLKVVASVYRRKHPNLCRSDLARMYYYEQKKQVCLSVCRRKHPNLRRSDSAKM